jgi:hypothetical protein
MNVQGIKETSTGGTSLTIKNSTVQNNNSGDDIGNTSFLYLFNNNTIGSLNNGGVSFTDGTNNIGGLSGNALVPLAPQ